MVITRVPGAAHFISLECPPQYSQCQCCRVLQVVFGCTTICHSGSKIWHSSFSPVISMLFPVEATNFAVIGSDCPLWADYWTALLSAIKLLLSFLPPRLNSYCQPCPHLMLHILLLLELHFFFWKAESVCRNYLVLIHFHLITVYKTNYIDNKNKIQLYL